LIARLSLIARLVVAGGQKGRRPREHDDIMARLSVNIDHVATVRQARRGAEPDPVAAAAICELAGAAGITVHLREDRRHIQDRDVRVLRETVRVPLNLEMAATDEMVAVAREIRPHHVTLVPEGRHEVTTEGGLDVAGDRARMREVVARLADAGIPVSMFIDPRRDQIEASAEIAAAAIEFHTGEYAIAFAAHDQARTVELVNQLAEAGAIARRTLRPDGSPLVVHAGHGLNYLHTAAVIDALPGVVDLNIGHAIVSRALLVGLDRAVRDMVVIINQASDRG
jgi:pyridoxine 5-phosphate synthase